MGGASAFHCVEANTTPVRGVLFHATRPVPFEHLRPPRHVLGPGSPIPHEIPLVPLLGPRGHRGPIARRSSINDSTKLGASHVFPWNEAGNLNLCLILATFRIPLSQGRESALTNPDWDKRHRDLSGPYQLTRG
jgi:hypothetical protein